MNFLFLPLLAVIIFGLLIFGYHFFKKDALFVFAIGCVIASNIYNIGSYPIIVGDITFGLDSVLYSVFIFCILLAYINHGKKDAMIITYTAMASIMLTAVINFIAIWASSGVADNNIMWNFLSYLFSVLGTYLAITLMIKVIQKIPYNYLKIIIGIIIASIINSLVYFGLISIATFSIDTSLLSTLAGSYLGKFMSMAFALISYLLISLFSKLKNNNTRKE